VRALFARFTARAESSNLRCTIDLARFGTVLQVTQIAG
jgi:hypothetical protein